MYRRVIEPVFFALCALAFLLSCALIVLGQDPVQSPPTMPDPNVTPPGQLPKPPPSSDTPPPGSLPPSSTGTPPPPIVPGPPPGSLPPSNTADHARVQWQADQDRWSRLSIKYDSLVPTMFLLAQEIMTLNQKVQPDNRQKAINQAGALVMRARESLHKADRDVNGIGKQLLDVERTAYYFADYPVVFALSKISVQYLDDANVQLYSAAHALTAAASQLNSLRVTPVSP